jgi:F-type H+-transporting ATPase subunit delta
MELTTIAKPYAKAINDIATSGNNFDSWQTTLDGLGAISTSTEGKEFISSPKLSFENKTKFITGALSSIIGRDTNEQENNLVALLVSNDRIAASSSIAELFSNFAASVGNKSKKISVISAYELSSDEQTKITADLKQKFGCEIILETSIDASLVGGVVIKDGDKVIDTTISASIEKLAACLDK